MGNVVEIIGIVLGSSVLSVLATALVNHKTAKQEREFNYADKLEQRLEKLERRVERFELRDNIYSSATACANSCKVADDKCPVLLYLENHPIPEKE